ncbi:hypothetical protein [Archangium primigenium]|uniref:hypothetical protein n=1 Tax=[Archangium] primigenium TaxID=2792470 RepID=UPI0019585AAC|nr:hypothetical protein [Archangium primigenium]MBM7115602.1 hypothetical protein [Archangium primigenium]
MKPATPPVAADTSAALRLVHGILFGGFTAITVVVGAPEFEQLLRAFQQPFIAGLPPRWTVMMAVLVALVGMGVILIQALRRRSAHVAWSALVLGALSVVLWSDREGPVPGRNSHAANLKILQTARALHGLQVPELQSRGHIGEDLESWRAALQQTTHGEFTTVYSNVFEAMPYSIVQVAAPDTLPEELSPGTLVLYVMKGGLAYELQAIGISPEGQPWRLEQSTDHEPVVFRGAFNPEIDMRAPAP